jgi:hypothetical protein
MYSIRIKWIGTSDPEKIVRIHNAALEFSNIFRRWHAWRNTEEVWLKV